MAGWKWRMAGGVVVLSSLACFPQTGRALDWLCRKDEQRPQARPSDCEFGYHSTAWRVWPEGCRHGLQACEQCRQSGACGPGGCRSDGATGTLEAAPSYESMPSHNSLPPGATHQWTTPIQPGHSPLFPGSPTSPSLAPSHSPAWTQPGPPSDTYSQPIQSSPSGTPIYSEPYSSPTPVFPPNTSVPPSPDNFEGSQIQGTGFRSTSRGGAEPQPLGQSLATGSQRHQPDAWQHSPQYGPQYRPEYSQPHASGRSSMNGHSNAANAGLTQPTAPSSQSMAAASGPRAWVVPMPPHMQRQAAPQTGYPQPGYPQQGAGQASQYASQYAASQYAAVPHQATQQTAGPSAQGQRQSLQYGPSAHAGTMPHTAQSYGQYTTQQQSQPRQYPSPQYQQPGYQQPYPRQQMPQQPQQMPTQNWTHPAMQSVPYGAQTGVPANGYAAPGYGPHASRSSVGHSPVAKVDTAVQQAGYSVDSGISTPRQLAPSGSIMPGYTPLHVSAESR